MKKNKLKKRLVEMTIRAIKAEDELGRSQAETRYAERRNSSLRIQLKDNKIEPWT